MMKGMLKCNVCGHEFYALKENHYVCRENGKYGLGTAIAGGNESRIYDAFDCSECGCQVIAQERKRNYTSTSMIMEDKNSGKED